MIRHCLAGAVLLLVAASAYARGELLPDHERIVLENGTVPLRLLRRHVEAWLERPQ